MGYSIVSVSWVIRSNGGMCLGTVERQSSDRYYASPNYGERALFGDLQKAAKYVAEYRNY